MSFISGAFVSVVYIMLFQPNLTTANFLGIVSISINLKGDMQRFFTKLMKT